MPRLTRSLPKPIAVIDFETDPFKWERVPKPFCVQFYSDTQTQVFWGDDCGEQLLAFLSSLRTPHLIYAHNGGKFDYHFLLGHIQDPCLIIKNRIVRSYIGIHEMRDSFAILPVALTEFGEKLKVDYRHFEKECREKYKDEILEYLYMDCLSLYRAVTAFIDRYGRRLTIGGTAIKELQKLHPFESQGSRNDETFRPYYMGGRVQCFKGGNLRGPWKLVDVNSMYPYAMANFNHPINGRYEASSTLPDDWERPFFITFRGSNRGALPVITDEGLSFTQEYGVFKTCSHELRTALKYGLVTIDEILECWVAVEYTRFDTFVAEHSRLKEEAKRRGDILTYVFEKLLMNSAYGRAGINPENFEDWLVHTDFGNEEALYAAKYKPQADFGVIELWSRPAPIKERDYCDVAIAASITSAARSLLLEGLQQAEEPVYCDTDSIICRDFHGDVDKYRLGAWDLELEADSIAIAGKKLYALFHSGPCYDFKCKYSLDPDPDAKAKCKTVRCAKLASKGGSLSGEDIAALCNGKSILYENPAPNFSLHKKPSFVPRHFRATLDLADLGA